MCKQILKSGKKCKTSPMIDSDYCFFHNPKLKKTRAEASAKGGKQNKHRPSVPMQDLEIKNISDVPTVLIECIQEIRKGNAEMVKTANAIGYLSNILLRAFELTDLENRIKLIESKI